MFYETEVVIKATIVTNHKPTFRKSESYENLARDSELMKEAFKTFVRLHITDEFLVSAAGVSSELRTK